MSVNPHAKFTRYCNWKNVTNPTLQMLEGVQQKAIVYHSFTACKFKLDTPRIKKWPHWVYFWPKKLTKWLNLIELTVFGQYLVHLVSFHICCRSAETTEHFWKPSSDIKPARKYIYAFATFQLFQISKFNTIHIIKYNTRFYFQMLGCNC